MESLEGLLQLPHDFDEHSKPLLDHLVFWILKEGSNIRQGKVVVIDVVKVEWQELEQLEGTEFALHKSNISELDTDKINQDPGFLRFVGIKIR